ncbi:uncharacterized protein MYCGRDRAFT_93000 [Zymoseptoria tritici IPO323]|uniref:Uncharacterized protein n=1 Tax=Zymoseptoria tritici (strain CBS 115943 / IPO323) TaxID=336722 RepID=F9XAP8_ZYMTI|nr:uncharacterized protein MYCGRDRAFT_93000 [Zymoseptoria tritici IPO323]EGP87735.1 hypothetical protein MYCGRDRAFT_93000 [Zymoseptoria tritici IPO323]
MKLYIHAILATAITLVSAEWQPCAHGGEGNWSWFEMDLGGCVRWREVLQETRRWNLVGGDAVPSPALPLLPLKHPVHTFKLSGTVISLVQPERPKPPNPTYHLRMKLHVFGIIAVATLVTAWRPCAKGGEGAGCGAWPCCGHYGCGHDNQCHLSGRVLQDGVGRKGGGMEGGLAEACCMVRDAYPGTLSTEIKVPEFGALPSPMNKVNKSRCTTLDSASYKISG